MYSDFKKEIQQIVQESIAQVLPDEAVLQALQQLPELCQKRNPENRADASLNGISGDSTGTSSNGISGDSTGTSPNSVPGDIYLVAIGKAAWQMAAAARKMLPRLKSGIVVTKYGHVKAPIDAVDCLEAGHPVPDDNTYRATEKVLEMVSNLKKEDVVLFLVSGGGSALFEKPAIDPEEMASLTTELLRSGADIVEINTVRKHLSRVKGGRFANMCAPARVETIILSDIVGDPVDMIAGGPSVPDHSTSEDALRIAEKYHLQLSEKAVAALHEETPKSLSNVHLQICGSVRYLVEAAEKSCRKLGYETMILTDSLDCEAREAGFFLGSMARFFEKKVKISGKPLAIIAGGETVVHVHGKGKGGRNQELSLAMAPALHGLNAAAFSLGSDGTDGPTDAAGGWVDGNSYEKFRDPTFLRMFGMSMEQMLEDNNAYEALKAINGLLMTGPTGTNVNDVSVLLIRPSEDQI